MLQNFAEFHKLRCRIWQNLPWKNGGPGNGSESDGSSSSSSSIVVHVTTRCDHISAVLHQLHWLPVRQRINYKIATLVHRSLSDHVQSYLADDCRLVTDAGVRRLRSADTRTLVVGRTQSSFGDRTFAVAAPRLWNSLPSDIRQPDLSYGQFRRSLKTFVFGHRATAQCDLH